MKLWNRRMWIAIVMAGGCMGGGLLADAVFDRSIAAGGAAGLVSAASSDELASGSRSEPGVGSAFLNRAPSLSNDATHAATYDASGSSGADDRDSTHDPARGVVRLATDDPAPPASSGAEPEPDADAGARPTEMLAATRFWVDAERGIVSIERELSSGPGAGSDGRRMPTVSAGGGLLVADPTQPNGIEADQGERELHGNRLRILLVTRGPRGEPALRRSVPEIWVWFNGRACAHGYLAESDAGDVGIAVFERIELHMATARLVLHASERYESVRLSGRRTVDLDSLTDFTAPYEVIPKPDDGEQERSDEGEEAHADGDARPTTSGSRDA